MLAVAGLLAVTGMLGPGRFDPGPLCVGFVVHKVAQGQIFPSVPRYSPSQSFHYCYILIGPSNTDAVSA